VSKSTFLFSPISRFKDLHLPNLTYTLGVLVSLGHLLYIPSYTICLTDPGTWG